MNTSSLDPRDYELLQRIAAGEISFRPDPDERADAPRWLQQVERLMRLSARGLIRMPAPHKTFLMPGAGYLLVGTCQLTTDGSDALERQRP
jgi:hypothetical protein